MVLCVFKVRFCEAKEVIAFSISGTTAFLMARSSGHRCVCVWIGSQLKANVNYFIFYTFAGKKKACILKMLERAGAFVFETLQIYLTRGIWCW